MTKAKGLSDAFSQLSDPNELKPLQIRARDTEVAAYAPHVRRTLGAYGDRAQITTVLRAMKLSERSRVLDAGCGVGRLTIPIAETARYVLAVDYSSKSITLLRDNLQDAGLRNVDTVVADLLSFDMPPQEFGAISCVSVIQHIPSEAARAELMHTLHNGLKPGGRIAVLVYRWRGVIDQSIPKEGLHTSGIYYHAFTQRELRTIMLQAGFSMVRVCGLLSLPGRLISRMPAMMVWGEPFIARLHWSVKTADFLLVVAQKAAG